MLRNLGRCISARFTSSSIDDQLLEKVKTLPFYKAFQEGFNLSQEKKYHEANVALLSALKLMDDASDTSSNHYVHILRKIVSNNLCLGKVKNAEETLYSIIRYRKEREMNQMLVYDDYNDLMHHYLRHDVNKAILLGKALLSDKNKMQMAVKQMKCFVFNLGNAYFLANNYEDAKKRYCECIDSEPQEGLKVAALNNLSLACWWHKNSPYPVPNPIPVPPINSVDSDFKQSLLLLTTAIQISENLAQCQSEERKYRARMVLDMEQMSLEASFLESSSLKPMYNLSQYFLHNEPESKGILIYWLQMTFKLALLHKNAQMCDQLLATLYLLTNEVDLLFQHSQRMLPKYQNTPYGIQFLKILSLRASEEQKKSIAAQIAKLEEQLYLDDPHFYKRKHIAPFGYHLH